MHDYHKDVVTNWNSILPDGVPFCHWGGKKASKIILDELDINPYEKVMDLCCGSGGTLGMANSRAELYGLDISHQAIQQARNYLNNLQKNIRLIQADAEHLPFHNNYFDKILSQDPDSFLSHKKLDLLREISRVLKPGAIFILQTYASTTHITEAERYKISNLLNELGYINTQTLDVDNLKCLFKSGGFREISITSFHDVYARDNLKMINLARQKNVSNLIPLLEFEKVLFSKKAWTGVLVRAIK